MGLFGPAWMSKKPRDAKKAVDEISEITSQDKLAKAARRAPLEKVREAAIVRLTDENALFDVAMNEHFLRLKILAARQISDQSLLSRLTRESRDREVVSAALERLRDQPALRRIAMESKDDGLVALAIRGIYDQEMLYQIARESRDSGVAAFAAGRITDQALLRRIVAANNSSGLRSMAAGRITDMELLRKLTQDSDASVRLSALRQLGNKTQMLEAALNDGNEDVRLEAARKLGRQDIVNAIQARREEARLNERLYWLKRAEKEEDCRDYKQIIDSVSGLDQLADIYKNARCSYIQWYARDRFLALDPPDNTLLSFLLSNSCLTDEDRFIDRLSGDGLLALIEQSDTGEYLASQNAKRAVYRFKDDPETLYRLYSDYGHKPCVGDEAWKLLYLDHREFLAKYGLKEKAEEDYARYEVELEKYKRQMDENMDRIPMDY